MSDRWIRAALAAVSEPGDPALAQAVASYGIHGAWDRARAGALREAWQRRARTVSPEQLEDEAHRTGFRVIVPGDDEWPTKLEALDECRVGEMGGAPVALWATGCGRLDQVSTPSVAVVGARACTNYGNGVAHTFAQELGDCGYGVISGGAYGIDAAAHQGALFAGGATVAVAAGGLDIPYPAFHEQLFVDIGANGVQVSEAIPGTRPRRHAFLARNRLIAALADATLIVEAALRSGAKNTTSWADALSRPVLAVPGPVTSSESETPNNLIRDHRAQAVTSVADVLAVLAPLGSVPEPPTAGAARPIDLLTPTQLKVRECLPASGSMSLDEICVAAGVSMGECAVAISELEEARWITATGPARWAIATPA